MEPVLHIRAKVRLLAESEGGRTTPIHGGVSYRPNHNFFGSEDRTMAVGYIEVPEGRLLYPGESIELPISFLNFPGLEQQIYAGREWRIQEGFKLVGMGTVIEVLSKGVASQTT